MGADPVALLRFRIHSTRPEIRPPRVGDNRVGGSSSPRWEQFNDADLRPF